MRYPDNLNRVADGANLENGDCISTFCESNEFITWPIGTLSPGAIRRVSLPPVVNIAAPIGSTISFQADAFEESSSVASATSNIAVIEDRRLKMTVDENVNPVQAGDELIYTLTYLNMDSRVMNNSVLSFPLPEGASFVNASNNGEVNGNTVEWSLGNISAHTGGRESITVKINDDLNSGSLVLVDSASIAGTESGVNYNAIASSIATIHANTSLKLLTVLSPAIVQPGGRVNTAITVSNSSTETLFGVNLKLRYPDNLNRVADGSNLEGGDCISTFCESSEFAFWNLGNLSPGSTATVTLPPIVSTQVSSDLVSFTTIATTDNGITSQYGDTVIVTPETRLGLFVDTNSHPVRPDSELIYTLTYGNHGSSSIESILSFPLPKNVSFISATGSAIFSASNNKVTWDLDRISARKGLSESVTVKVNSDLVNGTLLFVDKAEISGTESAIVFSAEASNVSYVNSAAPSLELVSLLSPDPVTPGNRLNTTITVSNSSTETLFGVNLKLRYPDNLNRVADGSNLDGGDCISTFCENSEFVSWSFGNLLPGVSSTVTLPPIVNSAANAGKLIHFDTVATADGGNKTINSKTIAIHPATSLELIIEEDANPVGAGEMLTYRLNYANSGNTSITAGVLSFPLPDGVSFTNATGIVELNGNNVEWNLGTIQAHRGERQEVSVTVNNETNTGSLLTGNIATFSGFVSGFFEYTEAGIATLVNRAPLSLSVNLSSEVLVPGDNFSITLTVKNTSIDTIFGANLKLRYPDNLNRIADGANLEGGDCISTFCESSEFIHWSLGNLLPGTEISKTFFPTVNASVAKGILIPFKASLTADGSAEVQASSLLLIGDFTEDLQIPANLPPVISDTPETTVASGNFYNFTPTASDPENKSLLFSIVNRVVLFNIH